LTSTTKAKYWYGFLNLKAAPHPDELVESAIKQRASENETSAAYPTYQDFTDGDQLRWMMPMERR